MERFAVAQVCSTASARNPEALALEREDSAASKRDKVLPVANALVSEIGYKVVVDTGGAEPYVHSGFRLKVPGETVPVRDGEMGRVFKRTANVHLRQRRRRLQW